MLANSIPFQCVKKCPLDFTLDGKLIQILKNSGLEQTDLEHLRTWLCHIFNHNVPNVKLRATTQLENRRIDCFSVDGFCAHCNTGFEAMG